MHETHFELKSLTTRHQLYGHTFVPANDDLNTFLLETRSMHFLFYFMVISYKACYFNYTPCITRRHRKTWTRTIGEARHISPTIKAEACV